MLAKVVGHFLIFTVGRRPILLLGGELKGFSASWVSKDGLSKNLQVLLANVAINSIGATPSVGVVLPTSSEGAGPESR